MRAVPVGWQRGPKGDDAIGAKADVGIAQPVERLHQEAATTSKTRVIATWATTSHAPTSARARHATPAGSQRRAQPERRRVYGRRQPEEHTRRQRHDRREPQGSKIERWSSEELHARRHELIQEDDRPSSDQSADDQAQSAEDQALSQQLPHDAAPGGAQMSCGERSRAAVPPRAPAAGWPHSHRR